MHVIEQIPIEIEGRTIMVERLSDGTYRKPDYLKGAERERICALPSPASNGAERTNALDGHWQDDPWITAPATPEAHRWHGYGTALAPAFETITLAMNPRAGTFAQNALEHGTGGLNIDGCRVPAEISTMRCNRADLGYNGGLNAAGKGYVTGSDQGRWPPNVLLTHDADCTGDACTEACPVRMLGEQSGVSCSHNNPRYNRGEKNGVAMGSGSETWTSYGHEDSGTASRFFPRFRYESKASKQDRGPGNTWPTVKPQALMRWLLTLVRQPGVNLVLDPFAGSGTTGVAAKTLGLPCILIDASEAACEIAARRLAATTPSLFQSEPPTSVPTPAPVQTRLDF